MVMGRTVFSNFHWQSTSYFINPFNIVLNPLVPNTLWSVAKLQANQNDSPPFVTGTNQRQFIIC